MTPIVTGSPAAAPAIRNCQDPIAGQPRLDLEGQSASSETAQVSRSIDYDPTSAHVPVFISEDVMQEAASVPEDELESEDLGEGGEERLEVFKDFVETLDLDDMESSGGNSEE